MSAAAVTLNPVNVTRPENASPPVPRSMRRSDSVASAQGAIAALGTHVPPKVGGTTSPQPPTPPLQTSPAPSTGSESPPPAGESGAAPAALSALPPQGVFKPNAGYGPTASIREVTLEQHKDLLVKLASEKNTATLRIEVTQETYERKFYFLLQRLYDNITFAEAASLFARIDDLLSEMKRNERLEFDHLEAQVLEIKVRFYDSQFGVLEKALVNTLDLAGAKRVLQDMDLHIREMERQQLKIDHLTAKMPRFKQGVYEREVKRLEALILEPKTQESAHQAIENLLQLCVEMESLHLIVPLSVYQNPAVSQKLADRMARLLMANIEKARTLDELQQSCTELTDYLVLLRDEGFNIQPYIDLIASDEAVKALPLYKTNPAEVENLRKALLEQLTKNKNS